MFIQTSKQGSIVMISTLEFPQSKPMQSKPKHNLTLLIESNVKAQILSYLKIIYKFPTILSILEVWILQQKEYLGFEYFSQNWLFAHSLGRWVFGCEWRRVSFRHGRLWNRTWNFRQSDSRVTRLPKPLAQMLIDAQAEIAIREAFVMYKFTVVPKSMFASH